LSKYILGDPGNGVSRQADTPLMVVSTYARGLFGR
jgi:hypothetical protein